MKPRTLQELFTDRSRWTQWAFARRSDGSKTGTRDSDASCLCLSGGLSKVYGGVEYYEAARRLDAVCRRRTFTIALGQTTQEYRFTGIIDFNDYPSTRFEDVLEVIKEANV